MEITGRLVAVSVLVVVMVLPGVTSAPAATMLETNDMVEHRHQMHLQQEELKSLSCSPKPGLVTIRNELQSHDYLLDEVFFPQVMSVSRCWESCSFCGNHHLGVSKGRCLPDPATIVKRPYLVFYFKEGKKVYRRVWLTEHTSCRCSWSLLEADMKTAPRGFYWSLNKNSPRAVLPEACKMAPRREIFMKLVWRQCSIRFLLKYVRSGCYSSPFQNDAWRTWCTLFWSMWIQMDTVSPWPVPDRRGSRSMHEYTDKRCSYATSLWYTPKGNTYLCQTQFCCH